MSRRPAPYPYSVLKQFTPLKITFLYPAMNPAWVLFFHFADSCFPDRLNDTTEEFVEICSGSVRPDHNLDTLGLVKCLAKEHEQVLEHLSGERNKFQAIIGALGDAL